MYSDNTFLIDLPMYPLINKTKFMKKNNYGKILKTELRNILIHE